MAKARRQLRRAKPALARTLSERLLAAIEARGLTDYALAKLAGIDARQLTRFIVGERDIKLGTADRIAEALGLDLVERGRARARPSPARESRQPRERPDSDDIPESEETE